MPLIKSAIKKMRKDKKRTIRNMIHKKRMKMAIKKALQGKDKTKAISLVDKAVKKGIIKLNKASRIKSKIAKTKVK